MTPKDLQDLLRDAVSPDWQTRVAAVAGLGAYEAPEAALAAERALRDADLAVVEAAVAALLARGAVQPLVESMKQQDGVGEFVADLVADAHPAWLTDRLIACMESDEPVRARIDAADILGFVLEAQRSLPALLSVSEAEDPALVAAATAAANHLVALGRRDE